MLYRIRNPNIRKLALVKNPASGHRFHLFKSAPEPTDAELAEAVAELSRDDAEELLAEFEAQERIAKRLDAIEAKLAKTEPVIRARQAIAKGSPGDLAAAVADLAHATEREEIVTRQRRILGEMRQRPEHATSWLYNEPTGSAEQVADYALRLK